MSDDSFSREAKMLRALLQTEPSSEAAPPRPPFAERLRKIVKRTVAARGAEKPPAGRRGAEDEPEAAAQELLLGWVRECLNSPTFVQTDRYRALANEVFVIARRHAQFRDRHEHTLFLEIARAVARVRFETAQSAGGGADAHETKLQASSGALTTVADMYEKPAAVVLQLERLSNLRAEDPVAWEAYQLLYFAGRDEVTELDRWYGDLVYAALDRGEKAVTGVPV